MSNTGLKWILIKRKRAKRYLLKYGEELAEEVIEDSPNEENNMARFEPRGGGIFSILVKMIAALPVITSKKLSPREKQEFIKRLLKK